MRRDEPTRLPYADTLVVDDEHPRLLVHRFGPDRLLLDGGTPFFPDQMALSVASVGNARGSGALPPEVDLTRATAACLRRPGRQEREQCSCSGGRVVRHSDQCSRL